MSLEAIRETTVSTPDGAQVPLGQLADVQIVERPLDHLPRGLRPLFAGQVQRPRARPRQYDRRGAGEHRAGDPQCDKAPSWVKLCRPTTRASNGAARSTSSTRPRGACDHHSPDDPAHHLPDVQRGQELGRHGARAHRTSPWPARAGSSRCSSRGMNFSVSAAMGFISIFGIAIQDAILVVTYFQRLRGSEGHTIEQAAREAAEKRLRPCLMTTLVAMIGLFRRRVQWDRRADAEAAGDRGHRRRDDARRRCPDHPAPLLVVAHRWLERHGGGAGGDDSAPNMDRKTSSRSEAELSARMPCFSSRRAVHKGRHGREQTVRQGSGRQSG